MNDSKAPLAERQVSILDLLAALRAGSKLIVGGTLILCVVAAVISLLLPEEFAARVQLLPPKEQKQGFGFADLLSTLPIPSLRLGEKGTPADIFIAILKSPTTRRSMIEQFDLLRVYEVEFVEDALEALESKTTVDKSEEGTIVIDVLDRDPVRAAAMANYYVTLLDSTNRRLAREAATERYRFIVQLEGTESVKLSEAMDRLQSFQAQHSAIAIEDQARAVIRAAAEMETASAELEITRQGLLASGLSPTHPQIRKIEQEFALRQQYLAFLRDGVAATGLGERLGLPGGGDLVRLQLQGSLFPPLREIPSVAQQYANLEKDVLVQSSLLKLLLEQKAESLIEASNTTSTVQVLDAAVPPETKARPRRFLIVFVTGVLSAFASTTYVLGRVYVRELQRHWQQDYAAQG